MRSAIREDHPIVVLWSDEDAAWIATVPDLASLSAHGGTAEEAARELMVAREPWFEIHRANGHPLPDPRDSRFWPDIAREHIERQPSRAAPADHTDVADAASVGRTLTNSWSRFATIPATCDSRTC